MTLSPDHSTDGARLELRVDMAACVGHGRCYALLPDLFEPDDGGMPVLTDRAKSLSLDREDDARIAVDCCPERAISMWRL